jgi:protein phosphatase
MLRIKSAGISHRGWVRKRNEDGLLIMEKAGFFAVTDGLGGLPGGAETSHLTLSLLSQKIKDLNGSNQPDWNEWIEEINFYVRREMCDEFGPETGCTLTMLRFLGDSYSLVHIGDSAAFRLRRGQLECLSDEHTVAEAKRANPKRTREIIHPRDYHVLTQCIGQSSPIEPQISSGDARPSDRFMISTDGLHRILKPNLLSNILGRELSPLQTAESLVDSVLTRGAPDNLTTIVIDLIA